MKTPPLQQTPSGGSTRLVRLLLGEPRTVNMVTLTSSDLGDKLLAASSKADLIQAPTPRRCMQCSREYDATLCQCPDCRCRMFSQANAPGLAQAAQDSIQHDK